MPSGVCRFYPPYALAPTLHLQFAPGHEHLARQILREIRDKASKTHGIDGREYKFW